MIDDLAERLRSGDRRALARAITLVESTRADHRDMATALLSALAGATESAVRLGISGTPGVGKSTFIEAFGLNLLAHGHRVAVLAIDPSSSRGGGSILGDKTRMAELSRADGAFIRPSPSGGSLGGIARRTREVMLLCAAAGYDVVIIETVGVGQSEYAVRDLVDMFVLLVQPAGGDELQGIKRGIIEIAEMIVVNKADGDLAPAAAHAQADYRSALSMLRPAANGWKTPVLQCSSTLGAGIDDIRDAVFAFRDAMIGNDHYFRRRADQAIAWMWAEVNEALRDRLTADAGVAQRLPGLEAAVAAGSMTPSAAAQDLLSRFFARTTADSAGRDGMRP